MIVVALLDTTVLLDFIGEDDEKRHAAGHVMSAGAENRFEPVVTLQSLQETIEVRRRRGLDVSATAGYVNWISKTFRLVGHEPGDAQVMLSLLEEHRSLDPSDAMIYAAGLRVGATFVITRDRKFGEAVGAGWLNPLDGESMGRLLADQ